MHTNTAAACTQTQGCDLQYKVREEARRAREAAVMSGSMFEDNEQDDTLQEAGFDFEDEDAFLGGGERKLSLITESMKEEGNSLLAST